MDSKYTECAGDIELAWDSGFERVCAGGFQVYLWRCYSHKLYCLYIVNIV